MATGGLQVQSLDSGHDSMEFENLISSCFDKLQ